MNTTDVLVVANRTAASPDLVEALSQHSRATASSRFTLLVPASPRGVAWAADMKAGFEEAQRAAAQGLQAFREAGLTVRETTIGDPDPIAAVTDELPRWPYDELIVATLPRSVSRWLRMSLPQRLRRVTALPIKHVVAASAGQTLWTGVEQVGRSAAWPLAGVR